MSDVKSHLASIPNFEAIQKSVDLLRKEKNNLIPFWGYLTATLGNPNSKKIENSFSGHALAPMAVGSGQLVALGICRIWDKSPPIPLATLEDILDVYPEIEAARKTAHPDWDPDWLEIGQLEFEVRATIDIAQKFVSSELYKHIRVLRTEQLAHALKHQSRDRKKYEIELAAGAPKISEAIIAAEQTTEIVDRIISHWEFHIENSMQSQKVQHNFSLAFWDALPNFSEVEDEKFVFGDK